MPYQSPSYNITVRLRYPSHRTEQLGRIALAIGEADGLIDAVDIVEVRKGHTTRDISIDAADVEHGERIVDRIKTVDGVEVLKVSDRTFLLHLGGKIEVNAKVPIKTRDDLSMAYTPGVARVCQAIHEDSDAAFALTIQPVT